MKLSASRSFWAGLAAVATFVLTHGVESLSNLRKLPSEIQSTYFLFQSWYYDDAKWTGIWSSREEGYIDDYKQAEAPLKLALSTERGKAYGEMFNLSVCNLSPMLPPVLIEGEIRRGKLIAYAFAYVAGEKNFLYSFVATQNEIDPVITLFPLQDHLELMPASARLVHRIETVQTTNATHDPEHADLKCPESPVDYLRRLRQEGKLKSVEELDITSELKQQPK